jgi:LuxR family transcriptional regulator, maltose regulon positive regulatory protein
VATRAEPDPAASLARGWADLEAGAWHAAREAFQDALARKPDPEAYEGASWAAWWLDDAEGVFAARQSAYKLYRKAQSWPAAARMATWLAADHLDFRGSLAVANGWLRRARRLLDRVEEGPEHGWLAMHEGYVAHLCGDLEAGREHALRCADLGRRFDVVDLEMLGLALEGANLVEAAKVDEGMARLDEATTMALEEEATIPISGAWACCFLVTACIATADLGRAFQWCDRIADFAHRYGSRYMLGFCRAEYGAVHLWRGQWAECEAMLEAAIEDFSRSRPALVSGPRVRLAELRRRQGREAEVEAMLEAAGLSSETYLCRARTALDRGDAGAAMELLERVLRRLPDQRRLQRAPVLQALVAARLAAGDRDGAAATLEELRALSLAVATPAFEAGFALAAGRVAAARGELDTSRAWLEDAVDGYAQIGAPFEAGEARLELATTLAALDRYQEAHREATAARQTFLELGAQPWAARASRLLQSRGTSQEAPALPELTPREREVLALVAEGLTNRKIAERILVSEHTVHRHVTHILRKLDLPSRAAAAAHAVRAGILPGDAG